MNPRSVHQIFMECWGVETSLGILQSLRPSSNEVTGDSTVSPGVKVYKEAPFEMPTENTDAQLSDIP